MTFIKRAYLHTIRKKGKTLLMLSVLLIMATLIQTSISISTATDVAATNVRKTLSGSFTVNAKHLRGGLSEQNIADIIAVAGVKDSYDTRFYTIAEFSLPTNEKLTIKTEGASGVPQGYENAGKIVGTNTSEKDTYFTDAGFELIEGTAITSDISNACLIHETLATQNNLTIGDSIVLANTHDMGLKSEVQIVGIFTNTEPQDALGVAPSYDLYENVVFTDVFSASQIEYEDGVPHYQYGDFYVDDPEMLPSIISEVQTISGIAWEECIVTKYDSDYQNAKSALLSLQNIIFIATVVIMIISTLLIALILSLWVRERIAEIGILLAMGISKVNILMQQLAELLIIAVIAFVLSFGVSSLVASNVGDTLMTSISGDEKAQAIDITTGEQTNLTDETETYSIEVNITLADWLIVCLTGTGIILVSVLSSSYPILKMKPKSILVKID